MFLESENHTVKKNKFKKLRIMSDSESDEDDNVDKKIDNSNVDDDDANNKQQSPSVSFNFDVYDFSILFEIL